MERITVNDSRNSPAALMITVEVALYSVVSYWEMPALFHTGLPFSQHGEKRKR